MKVFRLTYKFYIVFFFVSFAPAFWAARGLSDLLATVTLPNPIDTMFQLGVVEPPTTIAILFILFFVTDKWLWKYKPLIEVLGVPKISGRYEGTLVSSYDESRSYPVAVEIQQSLTGVFVTLYTENSSSYSLVADIGINDHKNWSLFYIYQNRTSTVNHDQDMKDHSGTCILNIFERGKILKGNYYNNPRDRGRHGSMELTRVTDRLVGRFESESN